jgi:DNA polymerase III gamma/tau subunit
MSTKEVLSLKNSSSSNTENSELQKILQSKNCGAFVVRGDRTLAQLEIKKTHSYEETFWVETATLGIDDVRLQISKTDFNTEASRLVVFSFYHITLEAQNALLKYLEEPPKNTTILLLTSASTVFLPTVLSRVAVCDFVNDNQIEENADLFLKTEPVHRMSLAFVKKMLLAKTENTDAIDKESIHIFIDSVIELCSKTDITKLTALDRKLLQNSISLVSRLKQNGASAKQILEYISLALYKR